MNNVLFADGICISVYVEWRPQFIFITAAVIAGSLRTISFFFPSLWLLTVQDVFGLLFFALLARLVFKRIFRDGPMTFYRIQGSVVIFLLIGLMYAMLYTVLERYYPNSLHVAEGEQVIKSTYSQMLYFSFVTMTTLGIGDMIPSTPTAKALVVFQGMIGLLYPVIMIARLVSLEVSHRQFRVVDGGRK
jgi:hypothetical protein